MVRQSQPFARPAPPPSAGYLSCSYNRQPAISRRTYKGYTITARTFQVRGSGRWTIDLLIGRRGSLRAFSRPETCPSEPAAIVACWTLGCRIIDNSAPDCSVYDLAVD
jgi:hypothetical protein